VLGFLLDEHLSPAVTEQLAARRPEIPVWSLQAWRGGSFLGVDDERLLLAAREDGLTLVTCDRRTPWPLLQLWAEQNISHAGVVFVSRSECDIGGLVRALSSLWDAMGDDAWIDRAVYL
jgi:hypothetical protein